MLNKHISSSSSSMYTVNILYSLWYTLILISNFIAFLVNDYYSCLGGPRHKPFGFQEDLHGHNYVLIVLS